MRICLSVFISLFLVIGSASANQLAEAEKLLRQGDSASAMQVVEGVLSSSPSMPEARFLKGVILVEQGKSDQAVKVFTALTRDYPELPEPYNNLAVIHAANGDYDSARMALQSALKTHPSYATAYENLGDIYAKLASEAYQQALDLEKHDQDGLRVKLALIGDLFVNGNSAAPMHADVSDSALVAVENTQSRVIPDTSESVTTARQVVAEPVADPTPDIMRFIGAWSSDWESQDVERYLSNYAPDFKPSKVSLKKWRMQRHIRLNRPDYIKVTISDVSVLPIDSSHSRVEFLQRYESNTYQDEARKRLLLVMVDGNWKILREESIQG